VFNDANRLLIEVFLFAINQYSKEDLNSRSPKTVLIQLAKDKSVEMLNSLALYFRSQNNCVLPRLNELPFLVLSIKKALRVTFSKNQRNRGHRSKFNFAHTLSIGRPRSHTY